MIDCFFANNRSSRMIFDDLHAAIEHLGQTEIRITMSQISFRRKRAFAWVWIMGKYLSGKQAPLVLSISLARRDPSKRWKEVVEPAKGRFMHHMELYRSDEIDEEVYSLLHEDWSEAG